MFSLSLFIQSFIHSHSFYLQYHWTEMQPAKQTVSNSWTFSRTRIREALVEAVHAVKLWKRQFFLLFFALEHKKRGQGLLEISCNFLLWVTRTPCSNESRIFSIPVLIGVLNEIYQIQWVHTIQPILQHLTTHVSIFVSLQVISHPKKAPRLSATTKLAKQRD